MKHAQNKYASEASENNTEITRLKNQLNETKTDAELYVQYEERHQDGHELCTNRQYDKDEKGFSREIDRLKRSIKTE